MEYIYSVNNLKKAYDGNTVLDIRELNIGRNTVTAVIGPSGAGKTTLLQILDFIEEPSEGVITFNGETYKKGGKISLETRRKMMMVFQKCVLLNSTVYENIAYTLRIRGEKRKAIRERVFCILELIGLKDKAHRRALTLSGGEAQRVAVARAIVAEPDLLFLDEPTANLDPANVALIEKLVLHAKLNYGSTIIAVTHNMYQAKRTADNVIFMMNGRVIEEGPPQKLFGNPENVMTKAFVSGEMVY